MAPEDMHEDYDEELDFGLGSEKNGAASSKSVVQNNVVVPGK